MKFYVTTPIYYVNDRPHIGHAYTTIVADVLARWHRQNKEEVFFLTGTDEHGTKVAKSAERQGKTPQEFCDEISAEFIDRWQKLNISNDFFIRTTSEQHKKRVQAIFSLLKSAQTPAGHEVIYPGEYAGLYCTGCEKFLTDKELVNGQCPDHKTAPEELKEKNYFFRLSDYKEILREKITKDEIKIFPLGRKNEALSMLEVIDDFSVSRETVKWGVDLPFDNSQKSYVWVDALSNYLTAIGYPDDENYQKWWPADVQLMAQDILKFHTIYWPAMLLALGLELPKSLAIHGFFTINGEKMSKSLGNVIDPNDLVEKFGADATRYLILSQFGFGNEADIQVERFQETYTADLCNGLGNLVSRVSNLIEKNNIKINSLPDSINKITANQLASEVSTKLFYYKFNEALEILWAKLRACDETITRTEPWKIKDSAELKKILEPIAQDIFNVAILLGPFMPSTAEKIIKTFTAEKIIKSEPLFPRI